MALLELTSRFRGLPDRQWVVPGNSVAGAIRPLAQDLAFEPDIAAIIDFRSANPLDIVLLEPKCPGFFAVPNGRQIATALAASKLLAPLRPAAPVYNYPEHLLAGVHLFLDQTDRSERA